MAIKNPVDIFYLSSVDSNRNKGAPNCSYAFNHRPSNLQKKVLIIKLLTGFQSGSKNKYLTKSIASPKNHYTERCNKILSGEKKLIFFIDTKIVFTRS